ncbi:MAG: hypothetical protein H7333_00635, partial [Bdellovibrionales bacterium]|nr:hypothetical protein [Oligoflexia bacterium]
MQKFSPLVLVGVILFASSCTHAPVRPVVHQPGAAEHEGRFEVVQLTPNFKAKRAVLSNGLKLIVVSDPSSPTFAYQTWFNVGSR